MSASPSPSPSQAQAPRPRSGEQLQRGRYWAASVVTCLALVLLVLALISIFSCAPGPTWPGPLPQPVVAEIPPADGSRDAAPAPPPNAPPCPRACAVLARFQCKEAEPTPRGSSCTEVCDRAYDYPGMEMPTGCILRAGDVAALRICGVCR